jgi:MYXO-CTERM domain-containing protein
MGTTFRNSHIGLTVGVLLGAAGLLGAESADACGGLFCANSPVDQNAERILFEVHEPGNISVTVEISYSGEPDKFSWIVPVSETPSEMSVAPPSSLRILDNATNVQIIPPPVTCSSQEESFNGDGDGDGDGDLSTGAPEADDGVVVEDLPVVGPYDPEVISSDDPDALTDWLTENDYLITDEMKPYIAEYVAAGYKFMGVKLIPDAGITDISPLKWTCPEGDPLIPIKLTAIAAEPEMGVLVYVAGGTRYSPVNYREIQVDTDLVQFDPATGQSNYYPLASWLIDEEGGKAMIAEYAATMGEVQQNVENTFLFTNDFEEAQTWVTDTLSNHAYLTRFYTRISAWEMDDDPVFQENDDGDNVSRVHDLSGRPAIEICETTFEAVPCGSTYCGLNSHCATTTEGVDGCVCNEGTVARAITAPRGAGLALGQTITCQETSIDVLQSVSGELADPCDGFSCGAGGTCLPVNGFATCECNGGYVAVNNFERPNGVRCELVNKVFSPEQLLWPEGSPNQVATDIPFLGSCTCATTTDQSVYAGLALLGLMGIGMTRRQRRAH